MIVESSIIQSNNLIEMNLYMQVAGQRYVKCYYRNKELPQNVFRGTLRLASDFLLRNQFFFISRMSKDFITLGVQRDSLVNNPLLQKSELGRPLRRCFTLPHDGFTYGKPNGGKDSSVADALVWRANHLQPLASKDSSKTKSARDFIALNRGAIQVGLTSAQEHFQYRATHDVRKKDPGNEQKIQKIKRIPPSTVYGLPTKPSTPVYELISHKYQDRWLDERRKAEESMRARQEQKRHVDKNIYETRASLLRKFQPPVDEVPLWQMPKFQKVPAKLESFRSDSAKKSAFKHHGSDCTSRKGVFGHGIYEPAKS